VIQVCETYVNETKGHMIGKSGWYEPYTDNKGQLFRAMQREYGRCISSMYAVHAGETFKVGWVFQSKDRYEDAHSRDDTYLREVWVEVRELITDDALIAELASA
jgi:hypothetical protein